MGLGILRWNNISPSDKLFLREEDEDSIIEPSTMMTTGLESPSFVRLSGKSHHQEEESVSS